MRRDPFTTDDVLESVAFKIRAAGDYSTAINESFGLRLPVPQDDLEIAEQCEALLRIMFSDELKMLEEALKRAANDPELPPLVRAWLIFNQFWSRQEENRRIESSYQALVGCSGLRGVPPTRREDHKAPRA